MSNEVSPNHSAAKPRLRDCWNALKTLSYGVYVVSAWRGGEACREYNAMTMRFVSQVSARPPRVAFSVSKTRLTHDYIVESGVFAVSVLSAGQELLAGHFGLKSGRDGNKFVEVEYSLAPQTATPVLDQCSAWFECRVEAVHDMGVCSLVVGEVLGGQSFSAPPLIYRESDYFG